ncbi:hypothetical protein AX14_004174 [Amanita brunnescens Koide BX004]|nr:hypothetical protein AX14_004174 [Amanita brunnescens Koide BX004]
MAEISYSYSESSSILSDTNEEDVKILRKQYRCPYFRILVIGRANAGKTTIIEKVCGVAKGTKPFVHNKEGKPSQSPFILCSCSRGMHDIEHQITYPGSNFIFHDSQGFESGATPNRKGIVGPRCTAAVRRSAEKTRSI